MNYPENPGQTGFEQVIGGHDAVILIEIGVIEEESESGPGLAGNKFP